MPAYYQAHTEKSRVPQVRQYDSSGDADIVALYEQAVADGAEFVIGPLDRDKVERLSQLEQLPAPILTLNYTETARRSEEHTSELQSRGHLVCRLLLEKKKTQIL